MAPPDQAPAPAKDPAAFRTIREVSELLGVPQHVLRFWETRFPELKPLQRGGNRRYYRPADVAFASALHKLLHQDGFTVKGVRKLITDHGATNLVAIANGESPAGRGRRADAPPPANVIAAQALPGGIAAQALPGGIAAQALPEGPATAVADPDEPAAATAIPGESASLTVLDGAASGATAGMLGELRALRDRLASVLAA